MEPNQSSEEVQQPISERSEFASKPSKAPAVAREEMSLDEIAAETGGYLIPASQTIRHDS